MLAGSLAIQVTKVSMSKTYYTSQMADVVSRARFIAIHRDTTMACSI